MAKTRESEREHGEIVQSSGSIFGKHFQSRVCHPPHSFFSPVLPCQVGCKQLALVTND